MITVACLLWGDWPAGEMYVRCLKAAVARHSTFSHRFVCIADREISGVQCLPFPMVTWNRNLPKMALYAPGNGLSGRVLAFDLDDIPVGPLDDLASYDGRFCCIEDPWETGEAGGGVLSFRANDITLAERLYYGTLNKRNGAERHWIRSLIPEADFWPRRLIADAKPRQGEIIEALPAGAVVAHFHGQPRPHEVDRGWLKDHWGQC